VNLISFPEERAVYECMRSSRRNRLPVREECFDRVRTDWPAHSQDGNKPRYREVLVNRACQSSTHRCGASIHLAECLPAYGARSVGNRYVRDCVWDCKHQRLLRLANRSVCQVTRQWSWPGMRSACCDTRNTCRAGSYWSWTNSGSCRSKTGAEMLFEILSQRYERSSTLVTSNRRLPSGPRCSVLSGWPAPCRMPREWSESGKNRLRSWRTSAGGCTSDFAESDHWRTAPKSRANVLQMRRFFA